MPEAAKTSQTNEVPAQPAKYYRMQIRGWTDFDPIDKKFSDIAGAIERGGGFLTAVEVLEVRDDLSAITDNVVRDGFQNILAVRRVLQSVNQLPVGLVEELRAALNSEKETAKKPVASESAEPIAIKSA